MATLADLLSVPKELEFRGATYKLREPTQLEQGRFQRWLEQRARESIDRATYLDDDKKTAAENAITRDIAAGVYEWGGAVAVEALQTQAGVTKLLEIILGIPAVLAQDMVQERLKELVRLIQAAQVDDPKAVAGSLMRLGLPADFLNLRKRSSSGSGTRRSRSRRRKSRR